MIIICGKTIAEVERDLEMAKVAIATGAPMGVGGATIEDVEQALRGLKSAMGESNPPISNPNYDPRWSCPECGAEYPAYDGECCDDCGYGYENEEEELTADNLDGLSAEEVDHITAKYGLPSVWADIMKKILGM